MLGKSFDAIAAHLVAHIFAANNIPKVNRVSPQQLLYCSHAVGKPTTGMANNHNQIISILLNKKISAFEQKVDIV